MMFFLELKGIYCKLNETLLNKSFKCACRTVLCACRMRWIWWCVDVALTTELLCFTFKIIKSKLKHVVKCISFSNKEQKPNANHTPLYTVYTDIMF